MKSSGEAGIQTAMPGEAGPSNPDGYTAENGGHPLKGDAIGYNGADAHGILVAGCVNYTMDSVLVRGITSENGKVTPVHTDL